MIVLGVVVVVEIETEFVEEFIRDLKRNSNSSQFYKRPAKLRFDDQYGHWIKTIILILALASNKPGVTNASSSSSA